MGWFLCSGKSKKKAKKDQDKKSDDQIPSNTDETIVKTISSYVYALIGSRQCWFTKLFSLWSGNADCLSIGHSDARVMWDQKAGRSMGFEFVSFRNQQDAQSAINDLTGKWLGSRYIRCNWATPKMFEQKNAEMLSKALLIFLYTLRLCLVCIGIGKVQVVLILPGEKDDKEAANSDVPEDNPQYTTVYVGNLAPEVTHVDLHCHFHALGAGSNEEVRVQRDKGFVFVRYSTHAEAAMAISMGNTQSFLLANKLRFFFSSTFPNCANATVNQQNGLCTMGKRKADCRVRCTDHREILDEAFRNGLVIALLAKLCPFTSCRSFLPFCGFFSLPSLKCEDKDLGLNEDLFSFHVVDAYRGHKPFISCIILQLLAFDFREFHCSWGNKPTPPGASSNPLPPPAPAALPGLSAADLLAYERQLAMSKMGSAGAACSESIYRNGCWCKPGYL
ncbi:UNVERIFIED_CONTAM: Oligouridylate-binding protein 1B [Sesamum indicum]